MGKKAIKFDVKPKPTKTDNSNKSASHHGGRVKKHPKTSASVKKCPIPTNSIGRLFVRNLPFKITLENLKKHFSQCGELTDATMMKGSDGRFNGLGYVQYASKEVAAKAISNLNGKPLLGRQVKVDWAIPKKERVQIMGNGGNIKTENEEMSGTDTEMDKDEVDDDDKSGILHEESVSQSPMASERTKSHPVHSCRKGRLFVKNLPFKMTLEDLNKHFSPCGELTDATILKGSDGKFNGCGFVQYSSKEDAAKAISNLNGKPLFGRQLTVDWAIPKHEYVQKKSNTGNAKTENEEMSGTDTEVKEEDETMSLDADLGAEEKSSKSSKTHSKRSYRKSRLIVRNLPFKITLEKLKEHFSQCGELTDASILKRPDGKLVGCGFVQYSSKEVAAKAISDLNGKPLLGRQVIVDWAIPKKEYVQIKDTTSENEEMLDSDSEVKEEDETMSSDAESGADDEVGESEDEDMQDDDDNEDSNVSGSDEDDEREEENSQRVLKSDVSEGCTVFIKNIPFSVDNEQLKETMKEFGPIRYALVCVDRLTEHSRGTGFVKFKSKANADACIAAGKEGKISLEGRILEVDVALSREDVKKPDKKSGKDNRNLYLAKEGLILPDSPAASSVSPGDMEKRLSLEEKKRRLLKNLHFFISQTRLVVYNIPLTYDNNQLKSLFLKHAGPKAVITEARVMRNLRDVDANGQGTSKGFGYVTFTSHENALQALRNLNNNPHIFLPAKRPIVMFSIENRAKLNIKQKRLDKSRRNIDRNSKDAVTEEASENNRRLSINPEARGKGNVHAPEVPSVASETEPAKLSRKERRKLRNPRLKEERQRKLSKKEEPARNGGHDVTRKQFEGVLASPGQTSVISKRKLEEKAKIYKKTLQETKKMNRRKKLLRSERIKEPKQKMGKPKHMSGVDTFSKLVNQYKHQLSSSVDERKKWYDA